MALTGDCYIGTYEGHSIELIRDNWGKTLALRIDGAQAARASCIIPGRRTLTATLVHNGVSLAVVAKSVPHRVFWTKDTIEINGQALALTKTY